MDAAYLGFLPVWVGDLFSVLGLPAIVLAVVVFLLNKKGANRKLVVEEGSLKKSEFDSFTVAQNLALAGAREEAATARAEAKEAKDEADETADRLDVMDALYDEMRDGIMWLRGFVKKLVRETAYTMTAEELREFDMTKPPQRPPRRRV